MTTDGKDPRAFVHSLEYSYYFEENSIFYRPPNHLNTMKRCIAVQFEFPTKNFGEDFVWTNNVAKSKLLKTQEVITQPYYFYLYRTKK